MNICCVVVTYNRKKLLLECVNALLSQTYKLSNIIIIDNNSNDGTEEFLKENNIFEKDTITYSKLDENIGGAGGFHEGIKKSLEKAYDWVWIMDDDTIPTDTALEELVKSLDELKNEKISFLCSKIVGMNDEEMNLPTISKRLDDSNYPIWMKYLHKSIIEVEGATFVSLLVNTDAIKSVGLPWKQFFIWGDDSEYTTRLVRYYGQAYVVGKSMVVHKRVGAANLSIVDEKNLNRIAMYKYYFRNGLINLREYYGTKLVLRSIGGNLKIIIKILLTSEHKYAKIKAITSGVFDFIFKRYDYKSFKNRFKY